MAALVLAGGDMPGRVAHDAHLLDRALAMGRVRCGLVAVSGSPGPDALPVPEGVEGPLAGLRAGLRWARERRCGWMQVIAADAGTLPPDLTPRLLDAAQAEGAVAAGPESLGEPDLGCSLWRVSALDQVEAWAADGHLSWGGLAELAGMARVVWAEPMAAQPSAPNVRAVFLGRIADAAGRDALDVAVRDSGALSDLVLALEAHTPGLAAAATAPGVRFAINAAIVEPHLDPFLSEGSEIAFLPPFSGG